jgi:hypothetical protein
MVGVAVPTGAKDFSLPYSVQKGSGAHKASYPMDNGGTPRGRLKSTIRSGKRPRIINRSILGSTSCIYRCYIAQETKPISSTLDDFTGKQGNYEHCKLQTTGVISRSNSSYASYPSVYTPVMFVSIIRIYQYF